MTQAERDRLVALKKAKKKLITQKEAAEELGITERHVRRLLRELKRRGDKVVAHGLRGLPSNPVAHKIDSEFCQVYKKSRTRSQLANRRTASADADRRRPDPCYLNVPGRERTLGSTPTGPSYAS